MQDMVMPPLMDEGRIVDLDEILVAVKRGSGAAMPVNGGQTDQPKSLKLFC
jgi:hypothetical protein